MAEREYALYLPRVTRGARIVNGEGESKHRVHQGQEDQPKAGRRERASRRPAADKYSDRPADVASHEGQRVKGGLASPSLSGKGKGVPISRTPKPSFLELDA